MKVSLPELQGARFQETLPRARAAESRGSLEGAGTPSRKEIEEGVTAGQSSRG